MKKIIITGGCGGVGTNLCSYLLMRDYEVVSFDNLSSKYSDTNILTHEKYEFIHGDIRLKEDIEKIKGDIVVHLAQNENYRSNIDGDLNVIEFCNKKKIPLIFCSNAKVYSSLVNSIPKTEMESRYVLGNKTGKYTKKGKPIVDAGKYNLGIEETFPMDGMGKYFKTLYGASKYVGDMFAQEFNFDKLQSIILRTSFIYGKYQFNDWLSEIMIAKLLRKPLKIKGTGKEVTDALYADDFSELIYMLINNFDKLKNNVFNVGGGHEPSFTISKLEALSLIDILDQRANLNNPAIKVRYAKSNEHTIYLSNISKLKKYWKPKTIVFAGFEKKFEWIHKNINILKERT